jgi:peptidyl-prolyl cis-trans isomerase A (cyclophilin A)
VPSAPRVQQIIGRRAACSTAAGAALAFAVQAPLPAMASGKAGSDGSWAKRFEEFTDADFEGFKTAPSGLMYKVYEEGFGVKPLAGQKIKAHYAGYLLNGAKFDSSYDRRSPLEFQVGVGRVIKGWDEALLDMQVGEKRILKIPSNLAYGSRGAGGIIPPDATLVFFVELVTLAA